MVLPNVTIRGQKTLKNRNLFTCWTVVEISTKDVLDGLYEAVSSYNKEVEETAPEGACLVDCDFSLFSNVFKEVLQLMIDNAQE